MTRLLTVQQCAALTATSPSYWRKVLARQELPHIRVGKRLVRVSEADLQRWLGIADRSRPERRED